MPVHSGGLDMEKDPETEPDMYPFNSRILAAARDLLRAGILPPDRLAFQYSQEAWPDRPAHLLYQFSLYPDNRIAGRPGTGGCGYPVGTHHGSDY